MDVDGKYMYIDLESSHMTCSDHVRPYQFDFMLLGQKWLANEVGRSV